MFYHISTDFKNVRLDILMNESGMDLDRRVRRVVLVRNGLRSQPLNVEALRGLQQRRQLRVVNTDLTAINKLQKRFQVASRNAGQHYYRMLACRILRKAGERS